MDPVRRRTRISLPQRQSAFLWGPRKTGKTTLLRALFPASLVHVVPWRVFFECLWAGDIIR